MISLAQLSSKTTTSANAGAAAAEGADIGAKGGEFASLLNAIGIKPATEEASLSELSVSVASVTPVEFATDLVAMPGTTLPDGMESGKILPVSLPGMLAAAGNNALALSLTPDRLSGATLGAATQLAGDVLPSSKIDAGNAGDDDVVEPILPGNEAIIADAVIGLSTPLASLTMAQGSPQPATPAPMAQAAPSSPQPAPTPLTTAPQAADNGAEAPAVTISVAASQFTAALSGAKPDRTRSSDNAAAMRAQAADIAAISASAPAPLMTTATPASIATVAPVTAPAAPTAMQDLAQIVDRLTAAREASVPAAAVVALNHADFGDLSLRFNQGREGGLSVQIAAADPDAHQAITAAVAQQQQQGAATPGDQRPAQDNAQSQQNARSRDAGANAGSGTNERGSEASQNGSNRQQQSGQQNTGTRHAAAATTANPRQGGIFA